MAPNSKTRYPFRFDCQNVLETSSPILPLPQQDCQYSVFNQQCVRGFVNCFTTILKTLTEFGTCTKSEADSLVAAITPDFLWEHEQNLPVAHDAVLHTASLLNSPWRGHHKAESKQRFLSGELQQA